ncbi:MAG: hypothetical protein HQK72_12395 [Desulfamplus sp.]|nr:hypothetical protein [Desulfamplus sp.]
MPDCEKLSKCLFFNDKMASKPASAEIFKKKFCKGDKKQCARYRVSSAGINVPVDLYPNQADKADTIMSKKK